MAIAPAPLSRALAPNLLERGIRDVYFRAYRRRVGEYERIFNIRSSSKQSETDVVMAGLAQFTPKVEGSPPDFDNIQQAWTKTFTHLTYGMGLRVTREMRKDDLYGVVMKVAAEQGEAAAFTQEVQAMSVFNNSAATQYTAGGTNFPLLSTAHYRQDDGTWSNRLSSGADLTPESLEALLTQWHEQMVDQRGNQSSIEPKVLVVGINDKWNAMRILNSDMRAYTADNDTNVLKGLLRIECMTRLTNDGRWFLLADKDDHTLQWINRETLNVERDTDSSGSQNEIYVGTYRASFGVSHCSGIAGSL